VSTTTKYSTTQAVSTNGVQSHTALTAADLAARYPNATRSGRGWLVPCPCHEDDKPSLSIFDNDRGVFVHCFASCDWKKVRAALGLDGRRNGRSNDWAEQYRVATYQHPDGRERPRYRRDYPADFPIGPCTWKGCTETGPHKHIWGKRWRSSKGCELLIWGTDASDKALCLVEGEKAALALLAHVDGQDYTPVTWNGGASVKDAVFDVVEDRNVILWPDADEAGKKAMGNAGRAALDAGAASLRLVDVADLREKADAADVNAEQALVLLQTAGDYEPPEQSGSARGVGRPARTFPVQWLMWTEQGHPARSSIANAGVALASFTDCAFSYDAFADTELLNGERIEDATACELWHRMEIDLEFGPTKEALFAAVTRACRAKSFHPVKDYLDGLRWDGKQRLHKLAHTHFGADDTRLQNAIARLIIYGMIARIVQPGAKFDYMPVLQSGKQGLAKSEALRILGGKWAGSGLSLDSFDLPKTLIERTKGKWLIECADLGGWRGSDIEKVKGVISDRQDSARMAYARLNVTRERQFIIVGTSNPREFLKDSQNRRFPVLEVKQHIDLGALRRDRDQLFAEALADVDAFKDGDEYHVHLPEALWDEAEAHSQQFRSISAFEEWFTDWIAQRGNPDRFTGNELIKGIAEEFQQAVHNAEKARVLNAAGYQRGRESVNGKRTWTWKKD